ncbi:MAG: YdeI/OmpD-associated family protein [Bacteroidales bacterium]|nr:YdeI/OmpD-associated family protein [Bacteroidales bacterium]
MNLLYIADTEEWRAWLELNCDSKDEIWLVYHKKASDFKGISYQESVEEAICYGWIDGLLRRLDDKTYTRRFTPRKPNSKWSEKNKNTAIRLEKEGRLTKLGLSTIAQAKKNGNWENTYGSSKKFVIPQDLKQVLIDNPPALSNFLNFSISLQARFVYWINDAKRQETRERRIEKVLEYAITNTYPTM